MTLRLGWPCLSTCGGVMKLSGRYKHNMDFGVYRCQKCGRETIETARPLPSDTTGADMPVRERPGATA